MKKMMLAVCLAFGFAQAQITVTTNGGEITNNQVFEYNTLTIASELPFIVTNNSEDDPINIKVRVDQVQFSDGTNLQLCFGGLCFFAINQGMIYPTNFAVTLEPGQSTMAGDHFWNSNAGDGINYPMTYRFTFVQVDDAGAYMGDLLTFTYRYGPNLGTSDLTMAAVGMAKINTLVSQDIQVETTENGRLDIMDLSGKTVVSRNLAPAMQTIEFASMPSGVYVARFTNSQNQSAQVKIVKQ